MNQTTIRSLAWTGVALLGLVTLLVLAAEGSSLTLIVSKNYNEGWNAFRAATALDFPAWLYPDARLDPFNSTNYPPLSFVLVGWLGRITGDTLIAGRFLAFASTIGIAIYLFLAARLLHCRRAIAALASLIFLAAPWVLVRFAAMNDPQMLGNLLDVAGLVLLLRAPAKPPNIILAALFFVLAEFVKPLFIALPLAALVWLWFHNRKSAFILAGAGLGFALIGYGLTYYVFHTELLSHLFSPRRFFWSKVTGQPGQWLLVEAVPFVASLMLLKSRRTDPAFFIGLYAALAFALAVFFSGGDGVSASQMMDVSVAVALGAALWLSRATDKVWIWPVQGAVSLLQAALLTLSLLGHFASRPALPELMAMRSVTRFDIDLIAAEKRPVLCETLALCHWAGKPGVMDAFGYSQALAAHQRSPDELIRLIGHKSFGLIQLQPNSHFGEGSQFWGPLVARYYLHHQDKNGLFLIPRD